MNRKHIIYTFLLGSIVLSGGCRKDLCYDHDRHGLTTRTDTPRMGTGVGT